MRLEVREHKVFLIVLLYLVTIDLEDILLALVL